MLLSSCATVPASWTSAVIFSVSGLLRRDNSIARNYSFLALESFVQRHRTIHTKVCGNNSVTLRLKEASPRGLHGCFGSAAHPHLPEDGAEMQLDGHLRQIQFARNFLVGQAARQGPQNIGFPGG